MLARTLRKFLRAEAAGITAFGLFMFSASVLMASYAIDVSNLEQQRTLLQATADSAAHDALETRETAAQVTAVAAARTRVGAMMNPNVYGRALTAEDVVFGTWDTGKRVFTPKPGSITAVRVTLRRTAATGNAVVTYLMKLVGVPQLDVVTTSTFLSYQPACLQEGFVAEGIVNVRSNNSYGICIHSNTYVSLNSNNYFAPGTEVSMPDLSLLSIPASGLKSNAGLSEALRQNRLDIRVLKRIQRIISQVADPSSPYYPAFLTDPTPIALTKSSIDATDLVRGHVYVWNCGSGNGGTIAKGALVSGVVIITDCDVTLANGSALEDTILLTTSTSAMSIKSPNGFRLGKDDHCVVGGGARIVSMGGMHFAAHLQLFGSQLLAMGDIDFAAQADGEGVSVISNGVISGTSNMTMTHCSGGIDEFTAGYFRMVD